MSTPSTTSVITVWLAVLAACLWLVSGTTSLAGWFAFAVVGLMPPLLLMLLSQAPARTTAEIIRDVEAGR